MNETIVPALLNPFLADCPEHIAVAVSGGPDSMALAYTLSQWAAAQDSAVTIHILTVDHGLRPEAAAEAAQVGRWLADWPHVRHEIIHRDLKGLGKTRILEGARDDRYRLLSDYCRAHEIATLFVAHHGDDQAETFLFRLAKGSGLDGLGCMKGETSYEGDLTVVRPFLPYPKAALLDYCHQHDIPYVQDPSNDDRRFVRPRLRQSARILAEEGLTTKRIVVTAKRLRRAQDALDIYASRTFDKALVEKGDTHVALQRDVWMKSPAETRLRMLKKAVEALETAEERAGYGLRMEKLENLADRLYGEEGFKSATLGGFLFACDPKADVLVISQEKTA